MNFVKAQLARIQQQLGGLSASQKMLTATLVAIMLGTLLWWAKYAGDPVMKPVLDQAMSKDEIATIEHALEARGITTVIQGDRVLVPSDRLTEALAELSYSQSLPTDTTTGFDDIVKQMSPWDTSSKQEKMWMEAKQRTLAQIIRHWKGVRFATVMIDTPDHRSFTEQTEATATVNISTNGATGPKVAQAAANLVAGATSGLKRSKVAVIVDSLPVTIPDKDNDTFIGNGELIEVRKAHEKEYEDKIRRQLSYISTGPVMVSVTVNVDTKTMQEEKHTPDAKAVVSSPTKTSEQHDETTAPSQGSGDPGVAPNTGIALNPSASGGNSNTSGTETNEFHVDSGYTNTVIKAPAGDPTVVGAAINVPRSYFVEIYKKQNPNAKGDPDDAVLQPIMTAGLQTIRDTVKRCTGLSADEAISVAAYTEVAPMLAMATEEKTTTSVAVGSVTDHAKEIAVGVLAVVSLFMVSSMARKSVPAPVITIPEAPKEPENLMAGDEVAGEVGSGENTLDAMELDEDSVKTQQMLDQVSTMVEENPEAAANLVKRWLNRT
jgi:flagellar M-ring protein FliF